tara:strand:+ start:3300 stop:3824 length:525 start_codon:yes stop_codon:yes gene_type:complete
MDNLTGDLDILSYECREKIEELAQIALDGKLSINIHIIKEDTEPSTIHIVHNISHTIIGHCKTAGYIVVLYIYKDIGYMITRLDRMSIYYSNEEQKSKKEELNKFLNKWRIIAPSDTTIYAAQTELKKAGLEVNATKQVCIEWPDYTYYSSSSYTYWVQVINYLTESVVIVEMN